MLSRLSTIIGVLTVFSSSVSVLLIILDPAIILFFAICMGAGIIKSKKTTNALRYFVLFLFDNPAKNVGSEGQRNQS